MKYIVAVSGGVDSVVLLDMLVVGHTPLPEATELSWYARESWAERQESQDMPAQIVNSSITPAIVPTVFDELIVAHFEHGIRGEDSKNDARFVELLSQKYRLKCEIGYGNLTKDASEDSARQKRYEFLKKIAAEHGGKIITAHHQDDLIETIAINLTRGTGWRGLAVFGDKSITRPLLGMKKSEIYDYALKNGLEWVEDETNQTDTYLRNRLRRKLHAQLDNQQRERLVKLYESQVALGDEIEHEVSERMNNSRYFLTMIPDGVALELLRTLTKGKLTRPQLERALLAIKTYAPGTIYEAGAGVRIEFTQRQFIVTNTSQML